MRIKTYLVSTLSEAVERIKQDLGPEAVILSTRRPQSVAWWKPGQPRLEVTAALDHGQDTGSIPTGRDQTLQYLNRVAEDKIEPLRRELELFKQVLTERMERDPQDAHVSKGPSETDMLIRKTSAPKATMSEVPDRAPLTATGPDALIELSRELLWHYMDPKIVQSMVEDGVQEVHEGVEVKEWAAQWIARNLPPIMGENQFLAGRKAIAFVGPTGSGKTTSLVKLASHLVLERKMKIAFVTLDHYKVGGEEHLRHYARILGIPCSLAKNATELKRALRRFNEADLVLVDTCGRSPKDIEGIAWLAGLIEETNLATVMVAPANLRGEDMTRVLGSYSILDPFSLIMTKLDETSQYGTLFNASVAIETPLAYFAMGQNVPEDFEAASIERVLDCLLNFSGIFPGSAISTRDGDSYAEGGSLQ